MELRHLRYFVAVAEELSFRKVLAVCPVRRLGICSKVQFGLDTTGPVPTLSHIPHGLRSVGLPLKCVIN